MSAESSDFTRFPSPHTSGNRAFLYLILLALFAFLFNLGGRPIEAKDYPRYAEIAREILEFGALTNGQNRDGIYLGGPQAPGKLAFVFPGQGSQYPGMGRDIACTFPQAMQILENANKKFKIMKK